MQLCICSVMALLAGAAMSLSFAPLEMWWVAPVCMGCLYALIQPSSSKGAAFQGFLFGIGYFGTSISWVYNSLYVFGGASLPVAVMLTALLVAFLACFPCLAAYWFRRFTRQQAARMTVFNAGVFASLWVVGEFMRGKVFGGFPWALVGYSQTDGPLGSYAPVIGTYGISFLVVFWSVLLTTLMVPTQPIITRIGSVVFLLLVPGAGIGLTQVSFSESLDEDMKVRIVQANIPQELKFSRESLIHSLEQYTELSKDAEDDTDLILWPETAIPTYYKNVEEYLSGFTRDMDNRGIDVLSGVFVSDDTGNFNAVRQLGGEERVYKKRHLVPFGEYVPLRTLLGGFSNLITIPNFDLTPGPLPTPVQIDNHPVGVSICFEDVFGEEMRELMPEATVLVNVSNDAWFGNSFAPHQHEQKARMRAREFSRPMVRATNTGVSSFIDEKGRIQGRILHNKTGVLDRTVVPQTGLTPYAATGNWPIGIFAFVLIFIGLGLHFRRCRVSSPP